MTSSLDLHAEYMRKKFEAYDRLVSGELSDAQLIAHMADTVRDPVLISALATRVRASTHLPLLNAFLSTAFYDATPMSAGQGIYGERSLNDALAPVDWGGHPTTLQTEPNAVLTNYFAAVLHCLYHASRRPPAANCGQAIAAMRDAVVRDIPTHGIIGNPQRTSIAARLHRAGIAVYHALHTEPDTLYEEDPITYQPVLVDIARYWLHGWYTLGVGLGGTKALVLNDTTARVLVHTVVTPQTTAGLLKAIDTSPHAAITDAHTREIAAVAIRERLFSGALAPGELYTHVSTQMMCPSTIITHSTPLSHRRSRAVVSLAAAVPDFIPLASISPTFRHPVVEGATVTKRTLTDAALAVRLDRLCMMRAQSKFTTHYVVDGRDVHPDAPPVFEPVPHIVQTYAGWAVTFNDPDPDDQTAGGNSVHYAADASFAGALYIWSSFMNDHTRGAEDFLDGLADVVTNLHPVHSLDDSQAQRVTGWTNIPDTLQLGPALLVTSMRDIVQDQPPRPLAAGGKGLHPKIALVAIVHDIYAQTVPPADNDSPEQRLRRAFDTAIHRATSLNRLSSMQVTILNAYRLATLPLIYGSKWESVEKDVRALNGGVTINQTVAVACPRRNGKTFILSLYAAIASSALPGKLILVFTHGLIMTRTTITEIDKRLKETFPDVKYKKTQIEIRIHHDSGETRIIGMSSKPKISTTCRHPSHSAPVQLAGRSRRKVRVPVSLFVHAPDCTVYQNRCVAGSVL
jgi:hypothetical protein